MREITAAELKFMKDSGKEFQLIDVREPYEVASGNLKGLPIPMGEIIERMDEIRKDIPVVIHCQSGKRSAAVIETLERLHGYQNLINLEGGISAYADQIDPSITLI